MTDSAFCQARKKLKHTAFITLNDTLVAEFYQKSSSQTWKNFRLLAVDGSTLRLPPIDTIHHHFGKNKEGVPLARISQCVDIHTA